MYMSECFSAVSCIKICKLVAFKSQYVNVRPAWLLYLVSVKLLTTDNMTIT